MRQCRGQERLTIATEPGGHVTEGVRSLEIRWIFPGPLDDAVAGWFSRFPAGLESREDAYLLFPRLRGLSVKTRAGLALEVKAYRGSPGTVNVAGRACGHIEAWQKWSYPCGPITLGAAHPASWRPVRKRRRLSHFRLAAGRIVVADGPVGGHQPQCQVELTEIRAADQDWWSLGLEATGAGELLRTALEATAALVFAQALPGAMELGPAESRSYAEWLGQRPTAGNGA